MDKDEEKKGIGLGLGSTPQKSQSDAESEMLKQQVMSNRQALLNNLSANQPGNPRSSQINQPAISAEGEPAQPQVDVEPVPDEFAMPKVFDSILETLKTSCVEANKSLASTDLELHCESPQSMQERISSKDGITYKFLRGHISLPNYSLVVDATERKIGVFIVPSEFVLGFDPDSHLFNPHLLIEFGNQGQNGWYIGNTLIGPGMLPDISRQLLRNLIGVARGEVDPKQPFRHGSEPEEESAPQPRDESLPQLPAVAPKGNLPSLLGSQEPKQEVVEQLSRSESIKKMMSLAVQEPEKEPVALLISPDAAKPSNGGDSGNLGLKGLLGDSPAEVPANQEPPPSPRVASLKDTNEFARLSQLISSENESRNALTRQSDASQSSGAWQRADEGAVPGGQPPLPAQPQAEPEPQPQATDNPATGMPVPPGMQRPQSAEPSSANVNAGALPEASGAYPQPNIEPPAPQALTPDTNDPAGEPAQSEPKIQAVTSASQSKAPSAPFHMPPPASEAGPEAAGETAPPIAPAPPEPAQPEQAPPEPAPLEPVQEEPVPAADAAAPPPPPPPVPIPPVTDAAAETAKSTKQLKAPTSAPFHIPSAPEPVQEEPAPAELVHHVPSSSAAEAAPPPIPPPPQSTAPEPIQEEPAQAELVHHVPSSSAAEAAPPPIPAPPEPAPAVAEAAPPPLPAPPAPAAAEAAPLPIPAPPEPAPAVAEAAPPLPIPAPPEPAPAVAEAAPPLPIPAPPDPVHQNPSSPAAEAVPPPTPGFPESTIPPASSKPARSPANLFDSEEDDDFEEESDQQTPESTSTRETEAKPYGASLEDLEKSLSTAAGEEDTKPKAKDKSHIGLGSIVDRSSSAPDKSKVKPEDVKPVISGISRPRNSLSSLLIPEEDEETVEVAEVTEVTNVDSKDLGQVVSDAEKHLDDGCSQLLSYVDKALDNLKAIGVDAMQNDNMEQVTEIMNQTKRLKVLRDKLSALKDDIK